MSDARCLNKLFLQEFIELYRSLPSLWKTKSKEYSNRNQKATDYEKLVDKLKEVDPTADRHSVIKKINSLRTNYMKARKEYMKANKTVTTTGSAADGIEEIGRPSLWYYDLLDAFLADQVIPRSGINSFNPEEIIEQEWRSKEINNVEVEIAIEEGNYPINQSTGSSSQSSIISPKRKKFKDDSDMILKAIGKRLLESEPESHLDYQAKSWAASLKELPHLQGILAEKLINDVIFEAKMGNLSRESKLFTNPLNIEPVVEYVNI